MHDTPELFDLYDADGRPLGRSKPREEVHRDGDWHRSAHVWIYTSDGRLLLQRRAASKDTWPGYLDASVGGHFRAGERPAEAVAREAREELGIDVEPEELVPLGVRRVESREPGIVDRELQDVYLLRRDLPLTSYRLDSDEIDALLLIDGADAARLHGGAPGPADADVNVEAEVLALGAASSRRHTYAHGELPVIPGRAPYIGAIARAVSDLRAGRDVTALHPAVTEGYGTAPFEGDGL